MAWLQLTFASDRDHAAALEDALQDGGAVSVTLQDNADEPVLEPGVGETPLWSATRVVALFTEDAAIETVLAALAAQFPNLPPWSLERIEDQAWERAWMADFQPMRFGRRLWICPSWCEPPDPTGVVLALDPGLAFGTGTHPTTAMCLQWLDEHAPLPQTVLDYGCGSGILSIAALKLGAQHAHGVDIDPQALLASRDNAERNQVSAALSLSNCDRDLVPASLVIANILAGPLETLAPRLAALTKPRGRIVLSGVLTAQAESVQNCYAAWFDMDPIEVQSDWARLSGKKR